MHTPPTRRSTTCSTPTTAGDGPGATHASTHVAYAADTLAEAQDALRAAMPGWLATTTQYARIDGAGGRDPHAYLERLLDIHPVGPPDLCVQRLTRTIATTGTRRLLLMVEGVGDAHRTLANIARLSAPRSSRSCVPSPAPGSMRVPAFDNGCCFR